MQKNGFTLVEVIVSIVIIGVVSVVVALTLFEAMEGYLLATRRMELTQEARIALVRMVREIRSLDKRLDSSGNNVGIITADAGTFQFIDSSNTNITFQKAGNVLRRSQDAQVSWDTLATHVSALTFKYYNASNAELSAVPLNQATINTIRWLSVEIDLSDSGQLVRMRSQVFPRDFGQ